MADPLDNPLGLLGFEFIEFASPTPGILERVFGALGFVEVARHRSKDAALYRQGGINIIVDNAPDCVDACFAAGNGPYVSGLALCVKNADQALVRALELGAAPMEADSALVCLPVPPLQGIGGIPLYLVDGREDSDSLYGSFEFESGVDRHPAGHGLIAIDHLAYDVYGGRLSYWTRLYERLFGSRLLRCHDIRDTDSSLGQAGAEGIRHLALRAGDPVGTLERLDASGVPLTSGHECRREAGGQQCRFVSWAPARSAAS